MAELDAVLVSRPARRFSASDTRIGVFAEYFGEPLRRVTPPGTPPFPQVTLLGPVALGTWLKNAGFSVGVYDNIDAVAAARDAFLAALDRRPLAVGVSTTVMDLESTAEVVGLVRRHSPQSLVVLGGPRAEWDAEVRALGDVTVYGPGEKTLAALVGCLRDGRDWRSLPNLSYLEAGREVRTELKTTLHPDELPAPDWSLVGARPLQCHLIEASKGCRYNCAFCSWPDRGNQRMRAVPLVVDEMRADCRRHGIGLLRFVDANLTSWTDYVEDLCAALARERLPLEWSCLARVDNFERAPKMAKAMHDAGCRWVACGIESGATPILKNMRKGYDKNTVLNGVRIAKEAGLRVHGNFIVGFPGETRATVDETLEVIDRCRPDTACFFVLDCEPSGSDMTESMDRFGLRGAGMRWSHATMDSAQAVEETRRCFDTVVHRMSSTLIGIETVVMYNLQGAGLSQDEVTRYLGAVRDYRRAKTASNGAGMDEALGRLGSLVRRQMDFWRGRGWSAPASAGPARV